VHMENGIGRNV